MKRSKGNLATVVQWTAFIAVAAVLAWRIVVINTSDHHAGGGRADDIMAALKWDPGHPNALLADAMRVAQADPQRTAAQLRAAIRANPADGRSYALLAGTLEQQGDLAGAARTFRIASDMAPRRTDVQGEAGAFWMRRGDLVRAMAHWNVVLTFEHDVRDRLFPGLLRLAENPGSHKAFAPLLQQELLWWPQFIDYAAKHATRLDTLRGLFRLQSKGPNEASFETLRAYLGRLQRDGYWEESYFVWLNSLDKGRIRAVGNLFNGGFDEPLTNLGFDWIVDKIDPVLVETAATYGVTGSRALHVVFRGPRVQYRHVRQFMMLTPGTYVLRGRVRPESLEAAQGVQWATYCVGRSEPLAATERFTGTDQWRHFGVAFTVRSDCAVQMVRLELAGRIALDFDARGAVWFDDLSIERQTVID